MARPSAVERKTKIEAVFKYNGKEIMQICRPPECEEVLIKLGVTLPLNERKISDNISERYRKNMPKELLKSLFNRDKWFVPVEAI
jgi:hypothetical protein